MGVSGSGKSTVGILLANKLHYSFFDADDFHPPGNVDKMGKGMALTDEERLPWLTCLNDAIVQWSATGINAVLACSALRESYRSILTKGVGDICFVYLKGDYKMVYARMINRKGHFMSAAMLRSQFNTIEEPEDAITISIEENPQVLVSKIKSQLIKIV